MAAQIRCGTRCTQIADAWVNQQVGELRRKLTRDLEIPEGAPAQVSRTGGTESTPVTDSYRLQHGELLEFVRPVGQKGA